VSGRDELLAAVKIRLMAKDPTSSLPLPQLGLADRQGGRPLI
jgi:hypothetical protein